MTRGPIRSARVLSLTGAVAPDTRCPPTHVGTTRAHCSDGFRGTLYLLTAGTPRPCGASLRDDGRRTVAGSLTLPSVTNRLFTNASFSCRQRITDASMAHIAIVEDEKNILTSLRLAFEHEGYSVETYDDPLVALPKLIFVPPDLLILNGHMPGMHHRR